MSAYKTPKQPAEIPVATDALNQAQEAQAVEIKTLQKALADRDQELSDLKTKVAKIPDYGPFGQIGTLPGDSEGYSLSKASQYMLGRVGREAAKYECDVSEKLYDVMHKAYGFKKHTENGLYRHMLVPFCTAFVPREDDAASRFVFELKHKMVAGAGDVDPDEVRWIHKRLGLVTKDIGTINNAQGGVLVGFPTMGELIDLQRNVEVFAQAGATEIALPPNGRLQYPKLTNATTAYWVGEGQAVTESQPETGYLDLHPKKLMIKTEINNELIRFGTISAEAMLRTDMAKVAALRMDLAELEGTGGNQIKGLITYDSASSWTFGQDKLITHGVTANTIQIADAAEMEAKLPDTCDPPTAWVMRRQLWAKVRNRRASAAVTTDFQGPFLTNLTRSAAMNVPLEWEGVKVVRSTQVSATRGSGSNTYVVLGNFKDWIRGRFGALEFLSTMLGDTAFNNDQTWLRCLQHCDAGPRHASSFVFADDIAIQ